MVDRFPTVIGQGLSLQYVSSVLRLCLTGYRQQFVDLADELLEKDPHCYSVVTKRVFTVGQGKVDVSAPENISDAERAIAEDCAQWVQGEVDSIDDLTTALTQLAWANYYGVSALEKMCSLREDGSLGIDRLNFIHYRRLAYPDPWQFDLYVWDQGLVIGPDYGLAPTQGVYGLRIRAWGGEQPPESQKFVVHAPQVRGNYPTREGLGRQLAYWQTLKLIATRLAPQYLERFAIPFAEFTFNTVDGEADNKAPRIATDADISAAIAAGNALGVGALASYVHSDAITLEFKSDTSGGASPKLTFPQWVELCDSQMTVAVLGATLTTSIGSSGGNRAASETQRKGEQRIYEYDGRGLASTFKRDVTDWLVGQNPKYRGLPKRLFPIVKIHVNDDPTASEILADAVSATTAGIPVDADQVAQRTNIPVVPNPDPTKPRRMLPIQPLKFTVANEDFGLPKAPDPPAAPDAPGKDGDKPNQPNAKPDDPDAEEK